MGPKSRFDVKKEGFLYKRGQRLAAIKHLRYFKLDGTHLSNYQKETDKEPTWEISLLKCTVTGGKNRNEVTIILPDRSLELVADSEADAQDWIEKFQIASNIVIENYYDFDKVIGEGQFGVVHLAFKKDTREKVAIKTFRKKNLNDEDYKYLKREIDIVTTVNHPNVVSTYEVFESEENIMIVMEYLAGGMLYDIIAENGTLTEQEASTVMLEILEGVEYLHSLNIVHRDLKPENMLCMRRIWPWRVKLCDFGLASFAEKSNPMETQVGTPYFAAPEVVKGSKYGPAVDLWSCGVILYTLLSGQFPFDDLEHPENTFLLIVKAQVKFPDEQWKHISSEAKDLVFRLLQKDPKARLTPQQAKEHPWIVSGGSRKTSVIRNDMSMIQMSLRNFKEAKVHKPTVILSDEESDTASDAQAAAAL